jgi:hypothetical protein
MVVKLGCTQQGVVHALARFAGGILIVIRMEVSTVKLALRGKLLTIREPPNLEARVTEKEPCYIMTWTTAKIPWRRVVGWGWSGTTLSMGVCRVQLGGGAVRAGENGLPIDAMILL